MHRVDREISLVLMYAAAEMLMFPRHLSPGVYCMHALNSQP